MANEKNKFEFVHEQEIKIDSEGNETMRDIYYTKKNGYFCSDSLSSNKETAKRLFDLVVKHNGELKTTTVLETIEN
jgi:hypothetical protein